MLVWYSAGMQGLNQNSETAVQNEYFSQFCQSCSYLSHYKTKQFYQSWSTSASLQDWQTGIYLRPWQVLTRPICRCKPTTVVNNIILHVKRPWNIATANFFLAMRNSASELFVQCKPIDVSTTINIIENLNSK